MALIEWTNEYQTGVGVIDYQHKKLVELINDLFEVGTKKEFTGDILNVIFQELTNYTEYHFSTEEELMRQVSYTKYDDHLVMHSNFIMALEKYKKRFDKKEDIIAELCEFLKKWLLNHILKEDKEINYYINTGGGLV